MKNKQLLASAALFRELYDSDRDIYDVIGEFIRASIQLNCTWTFNVSDCSKGLDKTFGFEIPDAVIKTCLKNRLKSAGEVSLEGGQYSVTEKFDRDGTIQEDFNEAKSEYNEVTQRLVAHVKSRLPHSIDENEELKIIASFSNYLLDQGAFGEYVDLISHFLLSNQNDNTFVRKLNQIEEGLILYAGIRYSSDLSTLGKWSGDLVVYLDTEHLFSAVGLNGILFKKIFDDFNSLVKDVNSNKKKNGSITLRYFEKTMHDAESFFYAAEKILEEHKQVNPSKTAMIEITNGCNSKSDVVAKKAKFFDDLSRLKITSEKELDYYSNPDLNVESTSLIESLKSELNHNVAGDRYAEILNKFTKINFHRRGQNNVGIEFISAIFLSENRLTQAVSFSESVYKEKRGIPFSTNIEFLTERVWFKLNKGFGNGLTLPASFDVITKAKLVLSSQVNTAIAKTYKEMTEKFDSGELNENQVALLISDLRSKTSTPEDFSIEIIDESIEFLNQNVIENVLREKSILEGKSEAGEVAIAKLKKLERKQHIDNITPIKRTAKRQYLLLRALFYIAIPFLLMSLLWKIYSIEDTVLSVIFGCVTALAFIFQAVNIKKFDFWMWSLSKVYYKRKISKLNKST